MSAQTTMLRATDGVELALHGWPAPVSTRARLLILHGRGEHGARYAQVADDLRPAGIACCALDLRGFGLSGPAGRPRGTVRRLDEYLLDLEAALDHLLADAAPPLFLLGQSAGGLIAVRFAQVRAPRAAHLAGLVLTAPFLGLTRPPGGLARAALGVVSAVRPDTRIPSSGSPDTRDAARAREAADDPLRVPAPTARWVTEMLAAQPLALAQAAAIARPLLVLQGEADTATTPAASRRLAEAAGGRYVAFPGCLHQLLHELPPDRERALREIVAFVHQHASS